MKELEEELKIVGVNMRELEVSEIRAVAKTEELEDGIRDLTNKLKVNVLSRPQPTTMTTTITTLMTILLHWHSNLRWEYHD